MVSFSVLSRRCWSVWLLLLLGLPQGVLAEESDAFYGVLVNGAMDGEILPDDVLTLREALTFLNGDLLLTDLSGVERGQVQVFTTGDRHSIRFDLPMGQRDVQVAGLLPPLRRDKVIIDGFMVEQEDHGNTIPGISLSPMAGVQVPRGLTISADDVTIQGMAIHGFHQDAVDLVANSMSADIWVGQAQFLPHPVDRLTLPEDYAQAIPQNTVIRDNWLGLTLDGRPGESQSDFGVWLHQAMGFVIERNRIYDHGSDAIVTGAAATAGLIVENQIVHNGLTGLADGIRLEGNVAGTAIERNLICGNGGSGIYFYRTQGATTIANNHIQANGDRMAKAAVFLMGSDHLVQNNVIREQNGAGVAIAAYPESHRNQIVGNVFADLQGLSIDLISQNNVGIQEVQVADGHNPPRNTPNRRKETANGAINAPRFLSAQFYPINGVVYLDGIADPGADIMLYQVAEEGSDYGSLNKIVVQTTADEAGQFSFRFDEFTPGAVYTAIAHLPDFGTSEPAANASIQLLGQPSTGNPLLGSDVVPRVDCPVITPAAPREPAE